MICDGGISRGTHVLKALSLGAKACSGGRFYLYALAAAGQVGVERALQNLHNEIERDMKLMGCRSINELSREKLQPEVTTCPPQASNGRGNPINDAIGPVPVSYGLGTCRKLRAFRSRDLRWGRRVSGKSARRPYRR